MINLISRLGRRIRRYKRPIVLPAAGTHSTDAYSPISSTVSLSRSTPVQLIFVSIERLPRRSTLPTLTAEHLIDLLIRYIAERGESIDLLSFVRASYHQRTSRCSCTMLKGVVFS